MVVFSFFFFPPKFYLNFNLLTCVVILVSGIEFSDEHWVLCASDELLNSIQNPIKSSFLARKYSLFTFHGSGY